MGLSSNSEKLYLRKMRKLDGSSLTAVLSRVSLSEGLNHLPGGDSSSYAGSSLSMSLVWEMSLDWERVSSFPVGDIFELELWL
jgi:hypothetical protein